MSDTKISGMTLGLPASDAAIEVTQFIAGAPFTRSLTLAQLVILVTASIGTANVFRVKPSVGLQLYDPTLGGASSPPWRTATVYSGGVALTGGLDDSDISSPVLTSAVVGSGVVTLNFSWSDSYYSGVGNLEVWRNTGSGFVKILTITTPNLTSFVDPSGMSGNTYKMRWALGQMATPYSGTVTAA